MRLIPTPQLLEQISNYAQNKGGQNYCLFLLGSKAGLRVSEAVSFNHQSESNQNFYQVKSKGRERSTYISEQVIRELKKHHWKPNSITRHGFYKFLRTAKKELNISPAIELTPHTLRRCFATYHANNGVPMTILQKVLGHSSIRTTSLYWRDTEPVNNLTIRGWLDKNPLPDGENKPKTTLTIAPEYSANIPANVNITKKPARKISPIISKNPAEIQSKNSNLIEKRGIYSELSQNTPKENILLKIRQLTTNNPQQKQLSNHNELTRLRQENKQLREQITKLKSLITKLQEQQKIEAQIELWKPTKSNHG